MLRVSRFALAAAFAVFAAACAVGNPAASFAPGSSAASVIERLGPPTAQHATPSGGRRLEYSGGAFGRRTAMLDFDASDRFVASDQVRTEAHFNTIQAGMSAAEVRARIGAPSTTWPIARQNQVVWSYRYETPFCQWFMVGMGTDDRVVDTAYGPDPLCDDNFFHRFRLHG